MAVKDESKQIAKCYEISEKTYMNLEKHFNLIKNIFPDKKTRSKNQWIQDAVSAYLKRLDCDALLQKTDKSRYLNLTLDADVEQEIEKKIAIVKQCGGNYTKRMLILEAIEAMIQEESEQIKGILQSNKIFQDT